MSNEHVKDLVSSIVGELEEREQLFLDESEIEIGRAPFKLAEMQRSTSRTLKWLRVGAEIGDKDAMASYAALLYGLNTDVELKGDEVAFWLSRLKGFGAFDASGHRARRHLTRLLLSGSLSKNQDSVLYRSFFRSNTREVHLLPFISKYLVVEKKEEEEVRVDESDTAGSGSLLDIPNIIFNDTSSINTFSMGLIQDNQYISFLPLHLSQLPNLKNLHIMSGYGIEAKYFDLSQLQSANISHVDFLLFFNSYYDSLSPLSLCDLSLKTLRIISFPGGKGLHPLNGISSDITRSLKELEVSGNDISDLSYLSGCDISSLEELHLSSNQSLSDISALRGSNMFSLNVLNLYNSNVSDLSPLCDCEGLSPRRIHLNSCPVEDVTPLSRLPYSGRACSLILKNSKVSDLSPLENISSEGVFVDAYQTPFAQRMNEEGFSSPLLIGKVTVNWE